MFSSSSSSGPSNSSKKSRSKPKEKTQEQLDQEEKIKNDSIDLISESLFDIIKNSQDSKFKCHMIAKLNVDTLDQAGLKIAALLNKFKSLNLENNQQDNETEGDFNYVDDFDDDEEELSIEKEEQGYEYDLITEEGAVTSKGTQNTASNYHDDAFDLLDSEKICSPKNTDNTHFDLFENEDETDDFQISSENCLVDSYDLL